MKYQRCFICLLTIFTNASAVALYAAENATPATPDKSHNVISPHVNRRFESDIAAVIKAIDASAVAPAVREALGEQWAKASASLHASEFPDDSGFRAVLPYNEQHTQLFLVQAALWKAAGLAPLTYTVPPTWDPIELVALPSTGGRVEVHLMRGEYRAAAVNLANASDAPIDVQVSFEGLPGSPMPVYVTVHDVPWTDTFKDQPVAAALPPAECNDSGWRLTVLPGLAKQLWLTFHVEQAPPGDYRGKLVVASLQQDSLHVPVRLRVYPIDFPRQTTLQLGGWDYSNGEGEMGVTPQNRKAFIEHLQEHCVNAPWSTDRVMMSCRFADDGTVRLDTQAMDAWFADWPDARAYYVFLDCNNAAKAQGFGGASLGTPEFDRNVGAWISAWVRHLDAKGVAPERLSLLLHDEPRETCDLRPFLAWAKAIRAAEPKVVLWEDPLYKEPAKAPGALFEACDVLCPNRTRWLEHADAYARFYRGQQDSGRTLHLYSCSGPARLLDPYSYYRLQAWHCWQVGATGSFFWAFGDNRGASSWNEYAATVDPFTPLFLDATTVTPGKHMEAIREGIEDYECIVLLQNAIHKAKAAGRADSALADAKSLLAAAADEVLALPGVRKLFWSGAKDRTKADAVRVRILETLSALNQ